MTLPPKLEQLAEECGVSTFYVDMQKHRHQAEVDSVLAVLGALGVELPSLSDVPNALAEQQLRKLQRGTEPVVVAWDREAIELDLTLPAGKNMNRLRCQLVLEDGSDGSVETTNLGDLPARRSSCGGFATYRLRLAERPGIGYHRLVIEAGKHRFSSHLICAPRRSYEADVIERRSWGCFLPVYAIRSERNWGAGDFEDLRRLVEWTGQQGGKVVGTLPLLAAFLDEPFEPSPYAPASRLAWNEFYVDVAKVPELAKCRAAADLIGSAGFQDELAKLRATDLVDYRRVMELKRQVIELLAGAFFTEPASARHHEFQQFLAEHPHVGDYAAFRATYETRHEAWQQWPERLRGGKLREGDYDQRSKQYHLYAQWIATSQLESLVDSARGGLYLDLPLGVRADGFDVWSAPNDYACDATAGAPPDAMWTQGQDWSFPPLHPERIRDDGYRHVRDYLVHHLRLAKLLRIDHVMQLHRLYWIPSGMQANQGVYVRYRADEFYALLSLESHRCQTTLIGENLGTVEAAVNEAMARHNMKSMYVVQYEIAEAAGESETADDDPQAPARGDAADVGQSPAGQTCLSWVPQGAMASLNTHDMPTFAAWWQGQHVRMRQDLGLLDAAGASEEYAALEQMKAQLTEWLRAERWLIDERGDVEAVLTAILKFLAQSEARVVLVNLEDMWLETEPQNVPGTGPELPNWKRKAALDFDDFRERADVLNRLATVNKLRRAGGQSARRDAPDQKS